jgi:hypothetical protein
MKKIILAALIGFGLVVLILALHRTPPTLSAPTAGRFQLHDSGSTAVVFDTATGRLYILRTNGTFIIRDPVLETERRTFSFEDAKIKPASTNQP